MNFKYMNKEAWLLDEDILYKGIVKRKWLRRIFIPNSHTGGFSHQYVKRNDIGKILFRNDFHIVYAGFGHLKRIYGDREILSESMETLHDMLIMHGLRDKQMIAIHRAIDALEYQLSNLK